MKVKVNDVSDSIYGVSAVWWELRTDRTTVSSFLHFQKSGARPGRRGMFVLLHLHFKISLFVERS